VKLRFLGIDLIIYEQAGETGQPTILIQNGKKVLAPKDLNVRHCTRLF
jgi:hypothetical protein